MKQKISATTAVIIIVVVIVAALVIGYLVFMRQPAVKPVEGGAVGKMPPEMQQKLRDAGMKGGIMTGPSAGQPPGQ